MAREKECEALELPLTTGDNCDCDCRDCECVCDCDDFASLLLALLEFSGEFCCGNLVSLPVELFPSSAQLFEVFPCFSRQLISRQSTRSADRCTSFWASLKEVIFGELFSPSSSSSSSPPLFRPAEKSLTVALVARATSLATALFSASATSRLPSSAARHRLSPFSISESSRCSVLGSTTASESTV